MDGIMIFFPEIKGVKILRKSLKIRYRRYQKVSEDKSCKDERIRMEK